MRKVNRPLAPLMFFARTLTFSLSLFLSLETFPRKSNTDKRLFRHGRRVVICRRLIEEHTHSALSEIPAFCEKMKTNVAALPFFRLDIARI